MNCINNDSKGRFHGTVSLVVCEKLIDDVREIVGGVEISDKGHIEFGMVMFGWPSLVLVG